VLWDFLSPWLLGLGGKKISVCGNFIAVRCVGERRSSRDGYVSLDYIPFNQFIDNNVLVDLPVCGRKYTWFKGDGITMSRLDSFLLLDEWCLKWPNCLQVAHLRGLFDHCPLML
jgi:hypothetical protein